MTTAATNSPAAAVAFAKAANRFLTALLLLVALACTKSPAPGDVLVGTWSNTESKLRATANSATFTSYPKVHSLLPCLTVTTPALRLDDSLRFVATGKISFDEGEHLRAGYDTVYSLHGRAEGNRLLMPSVWISPAPKMDTLAPGDGGIASCKKQ